MKIRTMAKLAICFSALAAPGATSLAGSPSYVATDLGTLGGSESRANALNDKGQVVGGSRTANDVTHAFLWQKGLMSDLGTLGGQTSVANGINKHGEITGEAQTSYSGPDFGSIHAFRYEKGKMVDLGTLGGSGSSANAINDKGEVVGYAVTAGGAFHAALWSKKNQVVDLGTLGGSFSIATGINGGGDVVGFSSTGDGSIHAFRWQDGVMTDIGTLGGGSSFANGINNEGEVVGVASTAGGSDHAFLWANGVMTDLGTLPGDTSSQAISINDTPLAVGVSLHGPSVAVLFDPVAHTVTAISTLVTNNVGISYDTANAISAGGSIAGNGVKGNAERAFLLTPVAGK